MRSISHLKQFYAGRTGRIVRNIISARIRFLWPDIQRLSLLGTGYAMPYLDEMAGDAERALALMTPAMGVHAWPQSPAKNRVCLSEDSELPLENNSIDRILCVHHLEHSEFVPAALQEIWRVLKANGRILIIVPNRAGLWTRADWSPFGQGTPFSRAQIGRYITDNGFLLEGVEEALFLPPVNSQSILKLAPFIERIGRNVIPLAAGVYILEASKQIFAPIDRGAGSRVTVRGRGLIRPVAEPF